MRRGRLVRVPLALGLLLLAARLPASAPAAPDAVTEDEILRQIKSDVFDQKWESVFADSERLIAAYPKSEALPRAYYYKAMALDHMPDRQADAMAAYGEFIDRFPGETLLREDALQSRMRLAKSEYLKGRKDAVAILAKGLEEKGYPRIYAAVQLSHLDYRPGRARALPILKECARGEKDAELRNECTLGILRIDPSEVPVESASSGERSKADVLGLGGQEGAPGEPKLIRLEVRDKATGKVKVAVNLPIAFAEALLTSLSEIDHGQVLEELENRGIDVQNLWKSLRTLGRQTLVQVETEEASVRVWLE